MTSEDEDNVRQRLLSRPENTAQTDPEDSRRFSGKQKRVLLLLSIGDFICFAALSIMAPLFPAEATRRGMSITISGVVFAVYSFIILMVSPYGGYLTSRVEPKILLTQGLGLIGVANILFGFSTFIEGLHSFTLYVILVRIMGALGAATYTASSYRILADLFPNDVGVGLTFLKIGVGFGMTLGPACGGILFDWFGFAFPFVMFGVLILGIIPLDLCMLPRCSRDDGKDECQSICSIWGLLKLHPEIIVYSAVIISISSSYSFLDPTLEPHLRKFNLPMKEVALFFMLTSGALALCSPLVGYLASILTRTWILIVLGLVWSSNALLLMGPSELVGFNNTVWVNVGALALLGASVSLVLLPTFEALLNIAISSGLKDGIETYGLVGSLWASVFSTGEVIGPLLGGFLVDLFGFPFAAFVFAVVTLFSGVALITHFCMEKTTEAFTGESEAATDSGISK